VGAAAFQIVAARPHDLDGGPLWPEGEPVGDRGEQLLDVGAEASLLASLVGPVVGIGHQALDASAGDLCHWAPSSLAAINDDRWAAVDRLARAPLLRSRCPSGKLAPAMFVRAAILVVA